MMVNMVSAASWSSPPLRMMLDQSRDRAGYDDEERSPGLS